MELFTVVTTLRNISLILQVERTIPFFVPSCALVHASSMASHCLCAIIHMYIYLST